MPSPNDSGSTVRRQERVAAEFAGVRRLAEFLQHASAEAGVESTLAIDLELAMVESANNIVEHGYAGGSGGEIAIELLFEPDAVVLTLSDTGSPIPPDDLARCRTMPLDAVEGRGMGIIQSCVDEIAYSSEGGVNRLRLLKRLSLSS
jgi:serine/threonine-protein kinase RsbW